MNKQFLTAQVIRACMLGIKAAEREERSPADYLVILANLADELEKPPLHVVEAAPSELEMHRADYNAIKEAGFDSPGELLADYKHMVFGIELYTEIRDQQKIKPWTKAEIKRLWTNSPEIHQDALHYTGFNRIVRLVEQAHGIGE